MDALYTAVATANGREGRAVSSDGQIDLALAMPPALGGNGQGTNPEQLFSMRLRRLLRQRPRPGRPPGEGRHRRHLGHRGDLHRPGRRMGFGLAVTLRIELPESLAGETGALLVKQAHEVCPYSKATRGNIPVELVIE